MPCFAKLGGWKTKLSYEGEQQVCASAEGSKGHFYKLSTHCAVTSSSTAGSDFWRSCISGL